MKLFGREPALWLGLISSAVMMFSAFVLPLTPVQQGVLNAVSASSFGLATAYFVARDGLQAAILGFVKGVIALGIAFGLHLAPENQSVILVFVTTVSSLFTRQTAVAPVSAANVERTDKEVKQISQAMKGTNGTTAKKET